MSVDAVADRLLARQRQYYRAAAVVDPWYYIQTNMWLGVARATILEAWALHTAGAPALCYWSINDVVPPWNVTRLCATFTLASGVRSHLHDAVRLAPRSRFVLHTGQELILYAAVAPGTNMQISTLIDEYVGETPYVG
jgi:hypothetical protein